MKITIIGSGNVATFYGQALVHQGWEIVQIFSPTLVNAAILARSLGAKAVDQLSQITSEADIFLIAVKDDAFDAIKDCPALKNKIIIHCSGSNSLQLFASISNKLGVLWPLYSVQKDHLPQHRHVPIIMDASDEILVSLMERLAHTVSDKVYHLNDASRSLLHLNAVLVNNFTNHLYAMSESICKQNNIDFEILFPIMAQGIDNALKGDLATLQTGPAIRKDWDTIQKHIELLAAQGLSTDVYKAISQSIINMEQTQKIPTP